MRRTVRLVIVMVVGTVLIDGAVSLISKYQAYSRHGAWYTEVRQLFGELQRNPPGGVRREEWDSQTGWLYTLHGNVAAVPETIADPEEQAAFLAELRERIDRKEIDQALVDWVWASYSRFTKSGKSYAAKFKPDRPRP